MPSKSVLIAQAFSKTGVLSTVVDSAPSIDTGLEQITSVDNLPTSGNDIGDQLFIENTNRLYIWNGSGWYNIALINTTPTWDSNGQPAATYDLSSDSPQTATIINLSASDPEGIPISYTYVTSGQMDSIATVSQDSSVFTITPKTVAQAPDGGTGSITFRATDGVNILPQVSSFTLEFITTITDSKHTSLLATATGTSDNNNITDASTNNHSITVNGDVYAGTFSPYRSGGYSTYFDGTGDNLAISANSAFDFGTGDFTFEMSFYAYVTSGGGKQLITNRASGWGAGVFQFLVSAAATNVYCTFYGYDLGGYTIVPETWYHISAVKSGDTITLYLNGATPAAGGGYSQSHSGVNNVSMGSSSKSVDIGSNGTADYFKGYITDLRIVKGTAITPPSGGPTKRLEAVTNTSLLTCHLPYIIDGSTNSHSITVNGDVSTKPFSPYDYLEYSATDHGGSIYFDGNVDYLENTTFSDITQTSNFTIEAWIYPTARTSGHSSIISTRTSGSQSGFDLRYTQNTGTLSFYFTGGQGTGNTSAIPLNQWSFVSVVRNGTTVDIYVNGNLETSNTSWVDRPLDTGFKIMTAGNIAASSNNCIPGYLSDLRILPSSVSDRNPPTEPLSSTNSLLHIKGTDASIIDKAQGNNLELFGNTTGSTTQVKFAGSKSMYFDGTGDVIQFDTLSLPDDFTIEYWLKLSTYSDDAGIFGDTGATNSQQRINHNGTLGKIMLYDAGYVHQTTNCFTQSEAEDWMHIAYSRQNGSFKLYVNGVQKDSVTSSSVINVNILGAGGYLGGNNHLNGYIQDFRITKGLARYTANFIPPIALLEA